MEGKRESLDYINNLVKSISESTIIPYEDLPKYDLFLSQVIDYLNDKFEGEKYTNNIILVIIIVPISVGIFFSLYFMPINIKVARRIAHFQKSTTWKKLLRIESVFVLMIAIIFILIVFIILLLNQLL